MSLHPQVLRTLLEGEAEVAREQLGTRMTDLSVADSYVQATFNAHGSIWRLRLSGPHYDRLPLSLSFVDEAGNTVSGDSWPPGVAYAGAHPILGTPWVCIRGTLEYHLFPGHTQAADSWDASRADLRIDTLLSHVLEKCAA